MDKKMKISEIDLPQKFVVKLLGRRPVKGLWGIRNTREAVDTLVSEAKAQNLSLPVVHLEVSSLGIHISHLPEPLVVKKPEEEANFSVDENCNEIINQKKPKSLLNKLHIFPTKSKDLRKKIRGEINDKENVKPSAKMDFELLKKIKDEHRWRADKSFFGIDTISYGVQDLVFTRVFSMIVVSEEERTRFHSYAFICQDRYIARNLTYSLSAAFQVYSRCLKERKPVVFQTPIKACRPKILSIDLRPDEEKRSLIKNCDSEA